MARLVAVALLAALLGVALPSHALASRASAAGSHAPPGGVYGGHTTQGHPMSLRLTRDGKQLGGVYLKVDAGMCSSSPSQIHNIALHLYFGPRVGVRADGSFSDTRHVSGRTFAAGNKTDSVITLQGRIGNSRAAGTIHVSDSVSDPNGTVVDRCDSGTVHWTLRRGNIYGGATEDETAVSIRVDHHRKRLRSFFIDIRVVCASTLYLYSLEHLGVAVRRDGTFSKRGITGLPLPGLVGSSVSGQYWLRGKLGARRASGTYRAVGTARLMDGTTLSCRTGVVRWTARRA